MRASLVLILRQRVLYSLNREEIKSYLTIIQTVNDRSNRREHLLFLEIFEQKKSQISELSAILDFGGYACDIISRVTQEFYP
jgi:hypothetical protein